jgi:uncharacterized membrane protein
MLFSMLVGFSKLLIETTADRVLALSAFVDLYLAIYPSTVLMKLHMPLKKRLALCAALGMGSVYVFSHCDIATNIN